MNIEITRSLGSNKSNCVINESCHTKKSTRKRFKKWSDILMEAAWWSIPSNSKGFNFVWSSCVCTYFSSILQTYTYHCAQCVTNYHLHVIICEPYYYLIAHNVINVYNILAVAVSVAAVTFAVDDLHHCPNADWFRYPFSFWLLPCQEVSLPGHVRWLTAYELSQYLVRKYFTRACEICSSR